MKRWNIITRYTPSRYEEFIQTGSHFGSGGASGGARMQKYVYFKRPVWKSSNEKIATVNRNGVVKGKKKGKATITVSYDIWYLDNSGGTYAWVPNAHLKNIQTGKKTLEDYLYIVSAH